MSTVFIHRPSRHTGFLVVSILTEGVAFLAHPPMAIQAVIVVAHIGLLVVRRPPWTRNT